MSPPARIHPDRAAGRDRDHRGPDRPAAAGRAVGPRGGPPGPVHQQPEADRPGDAQLRQRARRSAARLEGMLLGHLVDLCHALHRSSSRSTIAGTSPAIRRGRPATRSTTLPFVTAAPRNLTVSSTRVSTYYCPSDGGNDNLAGRRSWPVTSQNYVVNFGNTSATQDTSLDGVTFMGAPFTDIGSPITAIYGSSTSPLSTSSIYHPEQDHRRAEQHHADFRGRSSGRALTARILRWFRRRSSAVTSVHNSLSPDMMQDQSYCKYPFGQPPARSGLDRFHHAARQPPSRQRERRHGRRQRSLHQEFGRPLHLAGFSTTQGGEVISGDAY